jgi:molybdopterin synthase catalytic subunit
MDSKTWERAIPLQEAIEAYYSDECSSTGTVVIHAGRVKLPGKIVPDLNCVFLVPLVTDPAGGLQGIGEEAKSRFQVNRVQIHHRLGMASPGENLLLVLVSADTRGPAFDACRWIVDEIKKEKIIKLIEKR